MDSYTYNGDPMFFHSTKNIEILIEKNDMFAIVSETHMKLNSMSIRNYDHKEIEMIKQYSSYVGTMSAIGYSEMVETALNVKYGIVDDEPVYETDATLTNTDDLMLRGVRFKKQDE